MSNIDFINKIKIKNQKPKYHPKRTKKRNDTVPLKRTLKKKKATNELVIVGGSIIVPTTFEKFRKTSLKIIAILNRLNIYLSFDNVGSYRNKQFHTKLIGKGIIMDNYYRKAELNRYIEYSYKLSSSRTSNYANPYYPCTTYKQFKMGLSTTWKYIKKLELAPRTVYNILTVSGKGMKRVFNEFFDKDKNVKDKYKSNQYVFCYISSLIQYWHMLNTYIHEFKMLYNKLNNDYKADFKNTKYSISFDEIFNKMFKTLTGEYEGINEIDYRNHDYNTFTNLKYLLEALNSTNKYDISSNKNAAKLVKLGKLYKITENMFKYKHVTGPGPDGETSLVLKKPDIINNYKQYMVVLLISSVIDRLIILKGKLSVFYNKYTFPDIAPIVKYYIGRTHLLLENSLFKGQRTNKLSESEFLTRVNTLSENINRHLQPFLDYLNRQLYKSEDQKMGLDTISKYNKIINFIKHIKTNYAVTQVKNTDLIKEVLQFIRDIKKNITQIHIKYFDKEQSTEQTINEKILAILQTYKSTNPDSTNINTQILEELKKLYNITDLDISNFMHGYQTDVDKFFDGIITYYNKQIAVITKNQNNNSIVSGGGTDSSYGYPILMLTELTELYTEMMELCNRNIFIRSGKRKKDPKLLNSRGDDKPQGIESNYININFRNYILKILMGNIYFDEDIIHSRLPFKDDLDRALQFMPYYIQGQYFMNKAQDTELLNKIFQQKNFSNIVYLSEYYINLDKKYKTQQPQQPQQQQQSINNDTKYIVDISDYKKLPLSFVNLGLLTPGEISNLNGLDDASNLQLIMGEKGFEALNKKLGKNIGQRFTKLFGKHLTVNIIYNIGESSINTNTNKNAIDKINNKIKELITSRGSKKYLAGEIFIGGIATTLLGLISFGVMVPFAIGVMINIRNRRELYKYKTIEDIKSALINFINDDKDKTIQKFYLDEIVSKNYKDEFDKQVLGYFNLSRNVKFHNLFISNTNVMNNPENHKTTTQDILNNIRYLGKTNYDASTDKPTDISLNNRNLSTAYKYIIENVYTLKLNHEVRKPNIIKLARSVIIYLLTPHESKKTTKQQKGGGIFFTDAYKYKFDKIDTHHTTRLLNIINQTTEEKNKTSDFIKNIFSDSELDEYGLAIFKETGTSDTQTQKDLTQKKTHIDNIILLLGLTRIVESLLYYLKNVDSISKKIKDTEQLFRRHRSIKSNSTAGGGSDGVEEPRQNTDKTLLYSLMGNTYNGMSFDNGLRKSLDKIPLNMIYYYRNNLLDIMQSEIRLNDKSQDVTMDLARIKFNKVITKLLVYLKCNELSYDYIHSAFFKADTSIKSDSTPLQNLNVLSGSNTPSTVSDTQLFANILITATEDNISSDDGNISVISNKSGEKVAEAAKKAAEPESKAGTEAGTGSESAATGSEAAPESKAPESAKAAATGSESAATGSEAAPESKAPESAKAAATGSESAATGSEAAPEAEAATGSSPMPAIGIETGEAEAELNKTLECGKLTPINTYTQVNLNKAQNLVAVSPSICNNGDITTKRTELNELTFAKGNKNLVIVKEEPHDTKKLNFYSIDLQTIFATHKKAISVFLDGFCAQKQKDSTPENTNNTATINTNNINDKCINTIINNMVDSYNFIITNFNTKIKPDNEKNIFNKLQNKINTIIKETPMDKDCKLDTSLKERFRKWERDPTSTKKTKYFDLGNIGALSSQFYNSTLIQTNELIDLNSNRNINIGYFNNYKYVYLTMEYILNTFVVNMYNYLKKLYEYNGTVPVPITELLKTLWDTTKIKRSDFTYQQLKFINNKDNVIEQITKLWENIFSSSNNLSQNNNDMKKKKKIY